MTLRLVLLLALVAVLWRCSAAAPGRGSRASRRAAPIEPMRKCPDCGAYVLAGELLPLHPLYSSSGNGH